jgi:uncharacterized MAPEG superfamily protein
MLASPNFARADTNSLLRASMPIPVWVLLGFAAWTLVLLFATVGVYRWSRILTGRTAIATWRADEQQGSEWYRRAMRAHMNCVENLPVYTAIVVALLAAGVTSPILDGLAITILLARICQSTIHLTLAQTNLVASIRFIFFFIQAISMIVIVVVLVIALSTHG